MTAKAKPQTKSTKTTETFSKWVRQIKGASSTMVTIPVPITLSEKAWVVLAVDAAQRENSLDQHLQGAINSFLDLLQEDLQLTAKAA